MTRISPVLLFSLLLNAVLGWMVFSQHATVAETRVERREAIADAKACSDGVTAHQEAAAKRDRQAAPLIAAAASAAHEANRQADEVMARPDAVPGNACASAQALVDEWWRQQHVH